MWAGGSIQSPVINWQQYTQNKPCTICNRYYEFLINRMFASYGILHKFKDICYYCNQKLEKGFLQ